MDVSLSSETFFSEWRGAPRSKQIVGNKSGHFSFCSTSSVDSRDILTYDRGAPFNSYFEGGGLRSSKPPSYRYVWQRPRPSHPDPCYDRCAPTIFFLRFFNLVAYDLSQNLIRIEIKLLRDEKAHGIGTRRENHMQKKNCLFPTILGLRSPVIQKPFRTKSDTSQHASHTNSKWFWAKKMKL